MTPAAKPARDAMAAWTGPKADWSDVWIRDCPRERLWEYVRALEAELQAERAKREAAEKELADTRNCDGDDPECRRSPPCTAHRLYASEIARHAAESRLAEAERLLRVRVLAPEAWTRAGNAGWIESVESYFASSSPAPAAQTPGGGTSPSGVSPSPPECDCGATEPTDHRLDCAFVTWATADSIERRRKPPRRPSAENTEYGA